MRSAFGMIRDAAMRQARARARLAAVLLLALGLAAPAAALEIRAARVLPSGTVLAPSDLQVFGAARAGAHAPARAVAALLGQETQRTILQGMPIATSDVAPPTLVSRNDQVEIVVERGALRIRTFGRA
ncbi:MAG: flagellar basal body P-ring formation chaperone FlgA, partial [Pseudomonadota bacterium]